MYASLQKSTKNATTDDQSAENQETSSEPQIVEVQWDNGNIRSYNLQNEILRMFDNGPIGNLMQLTTVVQKTILTLSEIFFFKLFCTGSNIC